MRLQPPLPTFFSYAHEDRKHLDALLRHLTEFLDRDVIQPWADSDIGAGQRWNAVIIDRVHKSRLFLILISSDFISSPYSVGTELHFARLLYERRAAAIAPILVRACRWRIKGLQDLQVIMPFDGAVTSWPNPDEAWTHVADRIDETIQKMVDGTYFQQAPVHREVPALLPSSRRNREIQSFQSALAAAPKDRPFVCILTGDHQGQSEFIEFLAADEGPIRRTLGLHSANYDLPIDGTRWIRSREPAESLLNDVLALQVEPGPASEQRADIAAAVGEHDGLTLVRFVLTEAEWRVCGGARLNRFLNYWDDWPVLKPGRPVLVFLAIQAEIEEPTAPHGLWLPLGPIDPET